MRTEDGSLPFCQLPHDVHAHHGQKLHILDSPFCPLCNASEKKKKKNHFAHLFCQLLLWLFSAFQGARGNTTDDVLQKPRRQFARVTGDGHPASDVQGHPTLPENHHQPWKRAACHPLLGGCCASSLQVFAARRKFKTLEMGPKQPRLQAVALAPWKWSGKNLAQ